MGDFLFAGAIALILVLLGLWVVVRAKQQRLQARERERAALRSVAVTAATQRGAVGRPRDFPRGFTPTEPVARGGIEVDELPEVVDLEALLSSVPPRVAAAAREVLEEPTNIGAGPTPYLPPAPMVAPPLTVGPQSTAPSLSTVLPVLTEPTGPKPARRGPPPRPTLTSLISQAPLRELVLTWYRVRGYRASPASSALRPIDCVLRHQVDAARAYAVVCERDNIQATQVDEWLRQARSIGLVRLLIIAETGAEPAAQECKGVRILDRARMEIEMQRLDPQLAARIIALVGSSARAAAEPALGRS
jgi:hypothetical protein